MANTTYAKACELGYPYICGEPRRVDGQLCNRFTKTDDPNSDAVYVGWRPRLNKQGRPTGKVEWLIRYEPVPENPHG